mmetsp:Transcript_30864/g.72454  ORF Transcript_30864/g.72454 Transcript_30864/m.72454 type:complete len:153 (-) Transcript_30864:49-507(-)
MLLHILHMIPCKKQQPLHYITLRHSFISHQSLNGPHHTVLGYLFYTSFIIMLLVKRLPISFSLSVQSNALCSNAFPDTTSTTVDDSLQSKEKFPSADNDDTVAQIRLRIFHSSFPRTDQQQQQQQQNGNADDYISPLSMTYLKQVNQRHSTG